MNKRRIEPAVELFDLHGKKITCRIDGTYFDDCKVNVVGDDVYINQNQTSFNNGGLLEGYKYSYVMSKSYAKVNSTVKDIYVIDDEEYYYYEDMPETMLNGLLKVNKPIACYVSNYSEEEAIESGNVTWVFGPTLDGEFLTWDEIRDSIEDLLEASVDTCSASYEYAVPVKRTKEKVVKLVTIQDGVSNETVLSDEQVKQLGI